MNSIIKHTRKNFVKHIYKWNVPIIVRIINISFL